MATALLAARRGDHDKANALLRQVLLAEPGHIEAMQALLRVALNAGHAGDAAACLNEMVAMGQTGWEHGAWPLVWRNLHLLEPIALSSGSAWWVASQADSQDPVKAEPYYARAGAGSDRTAAQALARAAEINMEMGNMRQALRLATQAGDHPGADQGVRQRAGQLAERARAGTS
jgi:hypothetical protein